MDGIHYFNRCKKCHRMITKARILSALQARGEVCPCGGMMFSPTNPVGLEWLRPDVLWMCVLQLTGQMTPAPPPAIECGPGPFQAVQPLHPDEVRRDDE